MDVGERFAQLEARVSLMEGDHGRMLKAQEQMAADVSAIRQLIDKGKGGLAVLALLAAIAGGAGALLHKLLPATPWTPP